MPIDKVTQAQFAQQIATGINNRNANYDTAIGPIVDTCIQPQAAVLESQNDRARQLSLMLTLSDPSVFTGFETDLEAIVFNEGLTRSQGSGSTAVCIFARVADFTVDLPVQRGFPIGTTLSTSGGTTVTFVTAEAAVMTVAAKASFRNIQTGQYELSVPVRSLITGKAATVGPNQITQPLRPLANFDSVTNPQAAQGGQDAETNAQLIARYLLAITGRQTGVAPGIERAVLADFPAVVSIFVVYGTNPLLLRAATDGGAVDVWVQGSILNQFVENHTFYGVGQFIPVNQPPLVSIISVSSGGTTYTQGTDYEAVFDTSGVSSSTRAADGFQFIAGGTAPAVGALVTVTYQTDDLIITLQNDFQAPDVLELGRDLLFRRGVATPIIHTGVLTVLSGFSTTVVLQAVRTAILNFVSGLGLGGSVQGSDIQQVVRQVDGVDNYVITRLTLSTVAFGTGDVNLGGNQYPTLADGDLSITFG